MRTMDADTLLNNSWNKLSEAEQVVSSLITDLSSSDHYYENPSDAQSFKNFESALLQIQQRVLELQANIGLALKSRTKGTVFLRDKSPPAISVAPAPPELGQSIKSERYAESNAVRAGSVMLESVSNCLAEGGVKYPDTPLIPERTEFNRVESVRETRENVMREVFDRINAAWAALKVEKPKEI